MAKTMNIRMILGILAMMLLVPLAMPDSALALPKRLDVVSSKALCKELKGQIEDLEQKEKDGTITADEQGELNSKRELYDIELCAIVNLVDRDVAGGSSEDDDCTWKNLWCALAPVVEFAQTIASPDPGPTNPLPEPLPPLDPRPEPPDPLPPAPVPLGELSEERSGDPGSSGAADVDALAAAYNRGGPNSTDAELEKQGYKCGDMGSYGKKCTKRGAPDYLCDRSGEQCASVKTANPSPRLPKSPAPTVVAPAVVAPTQTQDLESQSLDPESQLKPQSLEPAPQQDNVENVASPSEVQGEVSSDQYSSGEGTEILADPGVELSEGSTTEAIR